MSKTIIISIDPTVLNTKEAQATNFSTLLNELFKNYPKNLLFKRNELYHLEGKNTAIKLTHDIIRRERRNSTIKGHEENRFEIISDVLLGVGSAGSVYKILGTLGPQYNGTVLLKTHNHRAVKISRYLKTNTYAAKRFQNETDSLKSITNLNAKPPTKVEEQFEIINYTVMREILNKNLFEIIFNDTHGIYALSVIQRLALCKKSLQALDDQVHANKIIHRDIKPENIHANSSTGEVDIIDFDLSKNISDNSLGERCGSPSYASPEQFNGTGSNIFSDIYSLGMIFAIIWGAEQRNPQLKAPEIELFPALLEGPNFDELSTEHKKTITDLIKQMTRYDKHDRINAKNAIKILADIEFEIDLLLIDVKFHSDVTKARQIAMETSIKLKEASLTKTSFEELIEIVRVSSNKISQGKDSFTIFVKTLDIEAFKTCTSSPTEMISNAQSVLKKMMSHLSYLEQTRKKIGDLLGRFNDIPSSLTSSFSPLKCELLDLDKRLSSLINKVGRSPRTIDRFFRLTDKFETEIKLIQMKYLSLQSQITFSYISLFNEIEIDKTNAHQNPNDLLHYKIKLKLLSLGALQQLILDQELQQKQFARRENTIKEVLMKVDEANSPDEMGKSVSITLEKVELEKMSASDKPEEKIAKPLPEKKEFLQDLFRPHPIRFYNLENEGNRHSPKN